VRGAVVVHAEAGPLHGTIENLSRSGALLAIACEPRDLALDLELVLGGAAGWASARAVRVEGGGRLVRLAVAFERVEPALCASIDARIEDALAASHRRPVLVVDDHAARRGELCARLRHRGMTPVAPRTPRDAIELLARAQLQVDVCLVAPSFGIPATELEKHLAESFPWVATSEITDDVEHTVERAARAWSAELG